MSWTRNETTGRSVWILALLTWAGLAPAEAANTAKLAFYANYEAASIYLPGGGKHAARAKVEYRLQSAEKWLPAHDLVKNAAGDLAGSLFYLKPATAYQVRVTLPEAGAVTGSFTTRDDSFPAGTHTIVVAPGESIQTAVNRAGPGTVVLVKPGIYRESITVSRSGNARAYILIKSEQPGKAVLEGSDPKYARPGSHSLWHDEGGGVFSVPMTRELVNAWTDGGKVYPFETKAEFKGRFIKKRTRGRGKSKVAWVPKSARYDRSFFVDRKVGKLFVRLPEGANPGTKGIHLPVHPFAVKMHKTHHVILDGFTVRHYGVGWKGERGSIGVWLDAAPNNVVRNCTIYGVRDGVVISPYWSRQRDGISADNTIEHNTLIDEGPAYWPWFALKNHRAASNAIRADIGRGTVVRFNRISGWFNGIMPGILGNVPKKDLRYPWSVADLDLHDNFIARILDDGIEPDGPCTNVRIWHNVFEDVNHGISACPNANGPAWIVRNLFYTTPDAVVRAQSFLKLANGDRAAGRTFVYHNTMRNDHRPKANGLTDCSPWKLYTLRNNIISGNGYILNFGTRHDGCDFDYDLLHSVTGKRFVRWNRTRIANLDKFRAASGQERHGLVTAPMFASEAPSDFRLASGSPAIDRGQYIPNISEGRAGIRGDAPDIGAFERGAPSPFHPRMASARNGIPSTETP